jgi:SAM-dependent methyltransferase/O-antigen/teichoic acid export membrane protein
VIRPRAIPNFLRRHLNESLYSGGYFIALTAFIPAALGYIFWVLVARLMNGEQVGIASTLLSVTAFLTLLSGLDLGTVLIRYLPLESAPTRLINTAIWLRAGFAVIASVIFLIGLPLWSPAQLFLSESLLAALLFVVANILQSINEFVVHIFVAIRQSRLAMLKNAYVALVRFPLVVIAVLCVQGFDGVGVYATVVLGVLLVLVFVLWRMLPVASLGYRFGLEFDLSQVRKLVRFSTVNFVAELALQTPLLLLPVIIANQLGNEESGIAYVVMMISSLVAILPQGMARSLLSEGSRSQSRLRLNIIRVLALSILLELVFIASILLCGRLLLSVTFGSMYASHGMGFLMLSTASVVPMTVVLVYFSLQRIRNHVAALALVGGSVCAASLIAIVLLTPTYKLTGVGIGLLVGQLVGAVLALPSLGAVLQAPHQQPRQPTEYSSNHKTMSVILDEQLADLPSGAWILDVGCGAGSLVDPIRQTANNTAQLIGIDIDAAALRVAREQNHGEKCSFVQYNGYDIPLPRESVDFIVAQEVIEHIPNVPRFLSALANVLKPGGLCLITTPNGERQPLTPASHPDHVKHYRPDELSELARAHGFEVGDAYYRYHFFSGFFDRLLLAIGRHALQTYEVQPHMTVVDDPNRHVLLHIYDRWIDPVITVIEQAEFRFMRRVPAPAQVCILRKVGTAEAERHDYVLDSLTV